MLSQITDSWVSLYANHAVLRTGIEFVHIGGLMAGGGSAIAADLATIAATRQRSTPLRLPDGTHRIVVFGLVALVVSGVLLFGADVETFLYSRIFWLKMGLMALLVTNGLVLLRSERQVARGEAGAWARLHRTAVISLVLWFVTSLAGAALPNIG